MLSPVPQHQTYTKRTTKATTIYIYIQNRASHSHVRKNSENTLICTKSSPQRPMSSAPRHLKIERCTYTQNLISYFQVQKYLLPHLMFSSPLLGFRDPKLTKLNAVSILKMPTTTCICLLQTAHQNHHRAELCPLAFGAPETKKKKFSDKVQCPFSNLHPRQPMFSLLLLRAWKKKVVRLYFAVCRSQKLR